MNSNTDRPDLSGVMRRLRKIMALAKSSNPGEAGAALHQAQVLMTKHNLTAESVAQIEITESSVKTTGKDLPKWESHLAVVVSGALGVELLVESQQKQQGLRRQNACIVFVGKGCAPEIAVYAYTVRVKASRKLPPSQEAAFSALGYQHGQNAQLNTAMTGGQQTVLLDS